MKDPRTMTLDELLSHPNREIRTNAYNLLRAVDIHQIEETERGVPLYLEPARSIKDCFRPLS